MEKTLQKIYLTYYNLLVVQDLWQALYQVLSINLLEGIHRIKFKCKHDNKKCETCGIRYKKCSCFFFNIESLR